jgi:hypothetical protein
VFTNRAYLQAWERGSTNSRKFVIAATNSSEVIQMNLEDKLREDLTEITIPKPK